MTWFVRPSVDGWRNDTIIFAALIQEKPCWKLLIMMFLTLFCWT